MALLYSYCAFNLDYKSSLYLVSNLPDEDLIQDFLMWNLSFSLIVRTNHLLQNLAKKVQEKVNWIEKYKFKKYELFFYPSSATWKAKIIPLYNVEISLLFLKKKKKNHFHLKNFFSFKFKWVFFLFFFKDDLRNLIQCR